MRVLFVAVLCNLATIQCVFAQEMNVAVQCSYVKQATLRHHAKNTVASPDELKYDVQHVHMDIALDNQSVAIAGNVTTTAEVTEGNFALYVCELNRLLQVDSVVVDGVKANFNRRDDIINVFMPVILQVGTIFKATVYYHGMPAAGSVFFFQSGMNNALAVEWGSPVTYTLSEPYNSKDWWPCKQSLQDKVDSADIWITVPDSLKAGSNGLLQKVTQMPGNKNRYEWKTSYPTAYYLLSVAVAAYNDYSFTRTMPDGNTVLVQNYIYARDGALADFKTKIDTTGDMLYYFSELFGTYPFYKEKYGHCMAPVFGGMEHQTMTTLHNFNSPLVAHELAHQWFGDYVTCASWRDIWLNEGFASYAEYLYAEKFWDEQRAYDYMKNVHSVILDDTLIDGSIYLNAGDTVSPYRIFDNRLSYLKASAVIHMLRYYINDDVIFFKILKQYQLQFANSNATTIDFRQLAEQISGTDLNKFFEQWIYGQGYPQYNITWNQLGNKVYVQIQQQTAVPSSVPFYEMPVEIRYTSQGWDTTMRVDNINSTQLYTFDVVRRIQTVEFDPGNRILNKETVARDYRLGTVANSTDVVVYPNPAKDEWRVVNVLTGASLRLTDMSGKVLWQEVATDGYGVVISAEKLARGIYVLYITDNNSNTISRKLIRL